MTTHRRKTVPNKLYFRIGEVSDIVGVKPYVLRYWETEFSDIRPTKSKSGQRLYKRRDVELLLMIRELLYEERYTIDGAKHRLRELLRGHREGQGAEAAGPATPAAAGLYAGNGAPTGNGHTVTADTTHEPTSADAESTVPANGSHPPPVVPQQLALHPQTGHVIVARQRKTGGGERPQPEGEKKLLLKLKSDLQTLLEELRS